MDSYVKLYQINTELYSTYIPEIIEEEFIHYLK